LAAAGFTVLQSLISPAIAEEHELKRVLREIDQVRFEAETTVILPRYCLPQLQPTKKPTRDRIYGLQQRLQDLRRRIAEIRSRYMDAGQTAIGTSYRSGFPPIDGLRPTTAQGAENIPYWGKAFGIADAAQRVIEEKKASLASKPEVDCSQPAARGQTVRTPGGSEAPTPAAQTRAPLPDEATKGTPFVPGRGHLEGLNPPGATGEGYVVRVPERFCSLAEKEAMQARFDAADARARAKAAEWEDYARRVEARKQELMKSGLEEHWQRSLDHEAEQARRTGESYLDYVRANATGRSLVASLPVVDCDQAMREELRKQRGRFGGGLVPIDPPSRESILDDIDDTPVRSSGGGRCVLPTNGLESPAGTLQGNPFSTTTKLKGIATFTIGSAGALIEAPPATVGGGSFSTTTKLKAEFVWRPPSSTCPGQGAGSEDSQGSWEDPKPRISYGGTTPLSPDPASDPGNDLLVSAINRIRADNGRSPIPMLPPQLSAGVQNDYIGSLADPILKGAPCDHDLRLWERLQTWGGTQGVVPRSELLTCVRSRGGGWEPTVAEQWRNSPMHFPIILRDADYLSCHRQVQGGKEFGVCITWRSSGGTAAPTPLRQNGASQQRSACRSLLDWYIFLPACIQSNQVQDPVGP